VFVEKVTEQLKFNEQLYQQQKYLHTVTH